jgi:hypothetical protein
MLAFALFYTAELLLSEAASLDTQPAVQAAFRGRALALLVSVARHSATWHVYRDRALRRLDELALVLAPEQRTAATVAGERLDWATEIEPLLAELAPIKS